MEFTTVAHFSGLVTHRLDLTVQFPWVYIIIAPKAKVVYIGETYDQAGLIVRLGRHFGRYQESELRKCASKHGILKLHPPFIVIAARLPFGEDSSESDASSKQIRLFYEGILHQYIASRFTGKKAGWFIISTSTYDGAEPESIKKSCESIYSCFESTFSFLESLTEPSPLHLVLLDKKERKEHDITIEDIGRLIERTELQLFNWIIDLLKREYAEESDSWWIKGLPKNIRQQCQTRKEDEGISGMPPEAYLTLIDFKDIVAHNWKLCSSIIESIAGHQGKDKGTKWIVELNEMRKLWAHPIKQKFLPIPRLKIDEIKKICQKIDTIIPK
jgi:hypothetical protein